MEMANNADRRLGGDRRHHPGHVHFPERRTGDDRRSEIDRRKGIERRSTERLSGEIDRRGSSMQATQTPELQTYYPDGNNQIAVTCPACSSTKYVDVSRFNKKEITAKCACTTVFKFIIEFRKNYRKKVKLPGKYLILKKKETGQMLVEDISMSGVGFFILNTHRINRSDALRIDFILDNTKRSEIHKKIEVMSVRDKFIGAKFLDKDYESDIGFYLKP